MSFFICFHFREGLGLFVFLFTEKYTKEPGRKEGGKEGKASKREKENNTDSNDRAHPRSYFLPFLLHKVESVLHMPTQSICHLDPPPVLIPLLVIPVQLLEERLSRRVEQRGVHVLDLWCRIYECISQSIP